MSDNVAIKVEHLSKKFARTTKRAMWYGLVDVARAALIPHRFRSEGLAGRLSVTGYQLSGKNRSVTNNDEPITNNPPLPPNNQEPITNNQPPPPNNQEPITNNPSAGLRPSEFWALRDVSFDVRRGECLGVIGANGAGKSTLFSILSGIYGPSQGRVEIRGSVQALIALGAGFHPMLTGRENVYINAAILGLKTREIDALYDEVVDFAEVRDFIDMPVGRYSSGMMVRLGFAVAVHMKPDILLVDEVLSVGDIAFRNKSFAKMMSLIETGIPVLFVSHFPPAIEMICTRVMWLDHGRVRVIGETAPTLAEFVGEMDLVTREKHDVQGGGSELRPIRIVRAETVNQRGEAQTDFHHGEDIGIRLHYECSHPVKSAYFALALRRPGAHSDFATCSMTDDALEWQFERGLGYVECRIPTPPLAHGNYEIRCGIVRGQTATLGQSHYQDFILGASFSVRATPAEMRRPGVLHSVAGHLAPVLVDHSWSRS